MLRSRRFLSGLILGAFCGLVTGAGVMAYGAGTTGDLAALLAGDAVAAPGDENSPWPQANTEGMQSLIDALQARERALNRREKTIEDREADLRKVEERLEGRLKQLTELRDEIRALMADADADRTERVEGVVKMVEAMRPKQAAGIISALPDDLAVEVLENMNRSKAGSIMAAMVKAGEPDRAANLTEGLSRPPLPEIE